MIQNEELGFMLRNEDVSEREIDLGMYRSGSAPPTIEGSLNAVGGLLLSSGGVSEEQIRSDPAYISYYYANVNMNPRLPPPLLSKEDGRFAQRMIGNGTGNGTGSSAIGDRRKIGREDGGEGSRSLFSMKMEKGQSNGEWSGDGLIGLPGLGLGGRQKSIAELIQVTLVSGLVNLFIYDLFLVVCLYPLYMFFELKCYLLILRILLFVGLNLILRQFAVLILLVDITYI